MLLLLCSFSAVLPGAAQPSADSSSHLLDKDSKQHLPHTPDFLSSCNPIRKRDGLSSGEMMAKLSFHTLESSEKDGRVPLGTMRPAWG